VIFGSTTGRSAAVQEKISAFYLELLESFPVYDIYRVVLVDQHFLCREVFEFYGYDHRIILVGVDSLKVRVAEGDLWHSSPGYPGDGVDKLDCPQVLFSRGGGTSASGKPF